MAVVVAIAMLVVVEAAAVVVEMAMVIFGAVVVLMAAFHETVQGDKRGRKWGGFYGRGGRPSQY